MYLHVYVQPGLYYIHKKRRRKNTYLHSHCCDLTLKIQRVFCVIMMHLICYSDTGLLFSLKGHKHRKHLFSYNWPSSKQVGMTYKKKKEIAGKHLKQLQTIKIPNLKFLHNLQLSCNLKILNTRHFFTIPLKYFYKYIPLAKRLMEITTEEVSNE